MKIRLLIFTSLIVAFIGIYWSQQMPNRSSLDIFPHKTVIKNYQFSPGWKTTLGKDSSNPSIDRAKEKIENFKYNQEVAYIFELEKDFPNSKEQLKQILLQPDFFANHKITVEPHTHYEIIQKQMGALKVLCLKILLEKEDSKSDLLQDLNSISENTKDPTMKDIVISAIGSVNKNRPFFKDHLEAVLNLNE